MDKIITTNQQLHALYAKEEKYIEEKVIKAVKEDSKAFFQYANRNKSVKTTIGPLLSDTTYESKPRKMAQILSKQYQSTFQISTSVNNVLPVNEEIIPLNDFQFTKLDFVTAMKEIKPDSSPGPDDIPAYIYRNFAEQLAQPIMSIWRLSLDKTIMPEGVIQTVITPMYKGGQKSSPENYRPIALTNHLTKIFERVLRKHIISHLVEYNLLNETQHGFTTHHSTISQLINFYESITELLETEKAVDAIYLDFTKAFNMVDRGILLNKIRKCNIGGKIL